jgi:protein-S-isoprenylcysteine O-methyltransferase Ste14
MAAGRVPVLMRIPPPLFYGVAFGLGLWLDRLVGWRPPLAADPVRLVGWGLIVVGVLLAPGSAGMFGLRRTTLNPAGHPSRLVTSGPFGLTRNPMYLGLALAYVGGCLVLGRILALAVLVGPLALINFVVIPFEETRMREAFPEEYLAYCRRVRRWM